MRFSNNVAILSSITAATVLAVPTSIAPTTGINPILATFGGMNTQIVQLGVSVNNVNASNIVGQQNLNSALGTYVAPFFNNIGSLHNTYNSAFLQSQELKQLNASETAQLIQVLNTLAAQYKDVLGQLNNKRQDFDALSTGDLGKNVSAFLNGLLASISSTLSGILGGGGNILSGGIVNGNTLSAVNRVQQGLNSTLADHNTLMGLLSSKIDRTQQGPLDLVVKLLASLFQTSVHAYAG